MTEWPDNMPLDQQVEQLANLLLDEFGGPTRSEGAIEMACRLLVEQKEALDRIGLAYIEAANPGIDMNEVRRLRTRSRTT